ncbi:Transcription factor MYB3R-1 [Camellia lanceoleosa]|uniref:Transcription factor MYB3R-1 n=1 Tax=Camellia lanceoleosa TaxID=1840588 RepID=A0ACC0GMC8_9ERIC|nr:Transcription factor MYB3R-1 [Camellia lanceoleosa]
MIVSYSTSPGQARWHNHLNPNISKEAWTQEEELTLISAHQIYGNKWAEFTKFLPGRKMDEKKEFVDLSSMMLFEATGDSEAISELNIAAVDAELMGAAEDDALSCSCDDLMDCELGKFDVFHVPPGYNAPQQELVSQFQNATSEGQKFFGDAKYGPRIEELSFLSFFYFLIYVSTVNFFLFNSFVYTFEYLIFIYEI